MNGVSMRTVKSWWPFLLIYLLFSFLPLLFFSHYSILSRRRMSICISWMKNIWCSPLIKSFSCDEQIAMAFNAELILDTGRSYGDRYEEKKKENIVKCKSTTRAHFVFLSLSCINAFNGFGLWTIWIKRGATNVGNFILSFFLLLLLLYIRFKHKRISDMLFSEQW